MVRGLVKARWSGRRLHVIDSHTGGEPTRVILDGGPDLGRGPLAERAQILGDRHENFYKSVLREPRGQPAMVAALLTEPTDPTCAAGVIYFDVAAVIGMCGHGTIGLAVTLHHLGRIGLGRHRLETPVGVIEFELLDRNSVRVTNVESYVVKKDIRLDVPEYGLEYGTVCGTIAYGGNMFFITENVPIALETSQIGPLTIYANRIAQSIQDDGLNDGLSRPIDHIILQQQQPDGSSVFARNFVLCPDGTFDRSPCGTGCSAILACLADAGHLAAGDEIIQESIIGSSYCLSYKRGLKGGVVPMIEGQAWVTSESKLMFDESDPFPGGIIYD